MDADARQLIDQLSLERHPEGGFYRENCRGSLTLMGLPHGGPRHAHTAIYYLLTSEGFSAFHRLKSDEVWHFYDGDPLELHLIDEWEHHVVTLGRDLAKGERLQYMVPAGTWQAAAVQGSRFSLLGCTCAPGFDFADFEIHSRDDMLAKFPQHEAIVRRFTHV